MLVFMFSIVRANKSEVNDSLTGIIKRCFVNDGTNWSNSEYNESREFLCESLAEAKPWVASRNSRKMAE
jgi:hypothetical protein